MRAQEARTFTGVTFASGTRIAVTPLAALAVIGACSREPAKENDRNQIQAALDRSAEATRAKDIDAFMAEIPDDMVLRDDTGGVITRGQLRTNILRDWGIIPKTISLSQRIDSLTVSGDSAIVYTSQRWERLMLERDGKGVDSVVTTERHRETWRRTARGWHEYDIQELGGEVFVNGKRVQPGR